MGKMDSSFLSQPLVNDNSSKTNIASESLKDDGTNQATQKLLQKTKESASPELPPEILPNEKPSCTYKSREETCRFMQQHESHQKCKQKAELTARQKEESVGENDASEIDKSTPNENKEKSIEELSRQKSFDKSNGLSSTEKALELVKITCSICEKQFLGAEDPKAHSEVHASCIPVRLNKESQKHSKDRKEIQNDDDKENKSDSVVNDSHNTKNSNPCSAPPMNLNANYDSESSQPSANPLKSLMDMAHSEMPMKPLAGKGT